MMLISSVIVDKKTYSGRFSTEGQMLLCRKSVAYCVSRSFLSSSASLSHRRRSGNDYAFPLSNLNRISIESRSRDDSERVIAVDLLRDRGNFRLILTESIH